MRSFWNRLKGKKTYLLCAICVLTVLLHAAGEELEGRPVDWVQVGHQVMACLITMALRQEMGSPGQGTPGPMGRKEQRPREKEQELFPE
jgi:hypothetical protein